MRRKLGFLVTAAALSAAAVAPSTASAASYSCDSSHLVAVGVPLVAPPLAAGTLGTGPNCMLHLPSEHIESATAEVSTQAGVVTATVTAYSLGQETSATCGPAVTTCAATVSAVNSIERVACSMTGLAAVLAIVSCRVKTAPAA
jgi:hypothetical protein